MLNEWSDRVDPGEMRSWWQVALDWAIGAMVVAGGAAAIFQIALMII